MRKSILLLAVGLLVSGGLLAAVLSFSSRPLEAQEQHSAQEPGQAWAWGFNYYGQLGNDTTTDSTTPVEVEGLTDTVAVAAGGFHNLALKQDGTVVAWGLNGSGELGDGTTTERHTPIEVEGLTDAVAVAVGVYHSLALKQDGTVVAWGSNEYGQLGDGTQRTERHIPVEVKGLTDVVAVAAGESHSLAIKSDGTVVAWGWNFDGQLGDGTTTGRSTPVEVQGLTDAVAVAGGARNSLALKQDGTAAAWGNNQFGQLGDGTRIERHTPVEVQGLTDAVAVASGFWHSLALKKDSTVVAWGSNFWGELGDGTRINRSTPVEVQGLTDAVAIAGGAWHSLALKQDGTIAAWGYNNRFGQLGDGTRIDRYTPVEVEGLTDAVAIAGGVGHSLAIEAKDASEQLTDQIALINSYNLHPPVQKALVATLQAAQEAVDAEDPARADKQLRAHIRQVEAQNGKALTEEQANDLIEAANRIRAVLGYSS